MEESKKKEADFYVSIVQTEDIDHCNWWLEMNYFVTFWIFNLTSVLQILQ